MREQATDVAAHLAAIVTDSDDAIVSKNLDGIILTWNQAAERLFGYRAEEAIGRSIRMLIPGDRQAEEDSILERVRRGERVDHLDTVRVRKDGSEIPVSVRISPIRDSRGRVIGASKIARDISERRRVEDAIEHSMALKDEFLDLASHEIRAPAATILGNARLLRERGDSLAPEEREQALADISTDAERLVHMVEHLLLLTRVHDAHDVEGEPVRVGLQTEAIVEALRRRHSDRTLTLAVETNALVLAEPSLLDMILDNLVGNALKYSPGEQPVEVLVREGEGEVTVTVADRGVGVAAGDRQAIFETFYRGARARRRAPGMGLGLAVCRRMVEALGGRIWVEPREGGGSEFSFTLPLLGEAEVGDHLPGAHPRAGVPAATDACQAHSGPQELSRS